MLIRLNEMIKLVFADVFFGPFLDYLLAPVTRYAGVWDIPVITSGGFAEAFNFKVYNLLLM